MAHLQITDTATHSFGSAGAFIRKMLISVGTGFTGTITVTDANGAVGIATNPVVGNANLEYWDLAAPAVVQASAAGNITVNTDSSAGAK